MGTPVALTSVDRDFFQGANRAILDGFLNGMTRVPVRPDTEYAYYDDIDLSTFMKKATTYTATTISFTAKVGTASAYLTDTALGFVTAGLAIGNKITISGSTSNNKLVTILNVTPGLITCIVTDTLVTEVAGDTVTILSNMKTHGLYIHGSRVTAAPQYGDSSGSFINMSFTNYAPNDATVIMRGINMLLNNYTAGTMHRLEGALFSVRQRKNSGTIGDLCGVNIAVELETGGSGPGAVSTELKGLQVDLRLHGNCPANSAGVEVQNWTDGMYAVPTAAFAVKNAGTSSCVGFTYGMDFYDAQSAAKTWNLAQIRMGKTAAEDVVIVSGNFVDGADSGFAPGSIGLDTTDGLLFVTDSSGLWQVVTV